MNGSFLATVVQVRVLLTLENLMRQLTLVCTFLVLTFLAGPGMAETAVPDLVGSWVSVYGEVGH